METHRINVSSSTTRQKNLSTVEAVDNSSATGLAVNALRAKRKALETRMSSRLQSSTTRSKAPLTTSTPAKSAKSEKQESTVIDINEAHAPNVWPALKVPLNVRGQSSKTPAVSSAMTKNDRLANSSAAPSLNKKPSPTVHKPIVVYSLLVVNIMMFLATMMSADWQFASFSENPTIGPSVTIFNEMGAKNTSAIVEDGQWWRLLVAGFLHGGVIHLALNMWVLVRIGGALEEVFGSLSFATVYLVSLIAGNLASAVFLPDVLGVGASGAIYGIVGAMFADLVQNWSVMPADRWSYLASLTANTFFGLLIGLIPLLDNFSHIGGLLAGFFVGLILLVLPRWNSTRCEWYWPRYCQILAVISLVVLVIYISLLFSLLYSDQTGIEACPSCRYLSCVDTSLWTCPVTATTA